MGDFQRYAYYKSGSNFWKSWRERNFSWKHDMDCVKHVFKYFHVTHKKFDELFRHKKKLKQEIWRRYSRLILCPLLDPQKRIKGQWFVFFSVMRFFLEFSVLICNIQWSKSSRKWIDFDLFSIYLEREFVAWNVQTGMTFFKSESN